MRTKQLLFSVFALVILCCNRAVAEEQVRDVPSFSAVSLKISGTVYLEQGNNQSTRVEASETALEELVTEVKDRTLIIRFRNNNTFWRSFNHGKIEIYVTVPDIEALSVSGSGNIESSNIKSRIMEFTVSGSGDISVGNLNSERIKATVSGSGNIYLGGGSADEFSSAISGSGKIKALDLETSNADIKVSGSGNCTLTAQKSLKARVSGSGGISYKGSPQLDTHITGSGRIKKL